MMWYKSCALFLLFKLQALEHLSNLVTLFLCDWMTRSDVHLTKCTYHLTLMSLSLMTRPLSAASLISVRVCLAMASKVSQSSFPENMYKTKQKTNCDYQISNEKKMVVHVCSRIHSPRSKGKISGIRLTALLAKTRRRRKTMKMMENYENYLKNL